ncbi:MAG TPA: CBS domain-containing protein, partial [Candidatus Alistipes pullicola]|nr:CBS domain-containing protein [Candidatus Alistipes pullicola]
THRSEMVWLNVNYTKEQIEETVKNNLFNTYPVADKNLDSIVGVVHLKDLFGRLDEEDFKLSKVLRAPQYIPENLSVYNALELMRTTGGRYGIVTDEFGSIEGIVTLKDIVRALIGSMPEVGEEQEIVAREDGSFLIDGQIPFYDFLAHFDMEDLYNEFNYNTLSGLILEELEHIPQTGEKLSWRNFDFEIVDMDAARIDKVLVSLKKPEEEPVEV